MGWKKSNEDVKDRPRLVVWDLMIDEVRRKESLPGTVTGAGMILGTSALQIPGASPTEVIEI